MTSGSKCFGYREIGHKQVDCKKSGKRALFSELGEVEDGVEIGEEPTFDDYGDTVEDELIEGDTGLLLKL
ncbi:hypothetical protein TorRG33x02_172740 [Trema orientale]|uniref:Zinc finger, CCHC-type n=1 Tax=Trema orientale TaxID=63057 RepID=A0A2P5EMW2_TREOI|nr:hypothetical protein TorRG33x02_172740 [Trema orientale]